MKPAPEKKPRHWWSIFRICFRWTRIVVLMGLLVVLCALTYLSEVGLPDFLKRGIVEDLHQRGVELRFSRLRWRWARGVVADDVHFGSTNRTADLPQLSLREAELRFDHSAMWRLKFKPDGIVLRGGKLSWPIQNTNGLATFLGATNIEAELRLLPDDQWVLHNLSAIFEGAQLSLSGSIANATALKDWPIFHKGGKTTPGSFEARLRQFAEAWQKVKFTSQPQLRIILHGDAANTPSFDGFLFLEAPGVVTPWCDVTNGEISMRLSPPASGTGPSKLQAKINVDAVKTAWASANKIHAEISGLGDDQLTNLIRARLEFSAEHISTPWADAASLKFNTHWAHSLTNPLPSEGVANLVFKNIHTQWADASNATLTASLQTPAVSTSNYPAWGFWNSLSPYVLGLESHVEYITAGDFESREVAISGNWKAPFLQITNLYTEMYQGHLMANAGLDVSNRQAVFRFVSDFDALRAYPLLPAAAKNWLDHQRFGWPKPPALEGGGSITLPEWTNRHPDWHGEVLPTMTLAGKFAMGEGSYRGIPFTNASSHIVFTNMTWCMPDLVAARPEGSVYLSFTSDESTRDYDFKIRSGINIKPLRPALEDEKAQRVFDQISVGLPPAIDAEIWGRWHEKERIGFKAQIVATNVTYKTESASILKANLNYTNKILLLTNSMAGQGERVATAESLAFDFSTMIGHLTNGYSTIDPMVVGRLIGPRTAESLEPYHFVVPPNIHVEGAIPLTDDISVSDMRFDIDGGPFEWWKFHLPHIKGKAHWRGDELFLENMDGTFYHGDIKGSAKFDFDTETGTDVAFDTTVKDCLLQELLADVSTATNKMEGKVDGHLQITRANTADPLSWFGGGHAELHEGLIWNIPIFGILTPVLNTFSTGLGESRISEGTSDFIITNSIIGTENLELRSPTLRLLYRGTVGFDFKVDAKVEAEVGRDTPIVGNVVSVMLYPFGKLFETRVTGTLSDPKREPVLWLTRVMSPLMHPWRVFNFLLPKGPSSDTNSITPEVVQPPTTEKK